MAETNDIHHRGLVAQSLAALGVDPDQVLACDVLAGGASGAYTYRLRSPQRDLVLKLTRPESSGHVLDRARREILFYERLATDVQLRVPGVVASRCDRAIGACLLLRAYEPAPDPLDWTLASYIQAAEQLGCFHARFWGKERELASLGWLRQVARPDQRDIRRAYRSWERLRVEGRFDGVLTPERHQWILGVLGHLQWLKHARTSLPITLCHGDFHIDNILVDSRGGMVIADWQEVGPGLGPEDQSFFCQRASHSGVTVPVDDMIEAYRGSLVERLGTDVPMGEIRRVMELAELRTRLLHWPDFLAGASERQMVAHLDRVQAIAARLGTGRPADS